MKRNQFFTHCLIISTIFWFGVLLFFLPHAIAGDMDYQTMALLADANIVISIALLPVAQRYDELQYTPDYAHYEIGSDEVDL